MRLSTLSRLDMGSPASMAKVALLGAESMDRWRSRYRVSGPAGLVGDTIDATLMLLVTGDISGCGSRLVVVGEGVLSFCDWWKPPFVGLKTLTAWYDAAEVSAFAKGLGQLSSQLTTLHDRFDSRLLDASVLE